MRTKYVPLETPPAMKLVAVLPVENDARLLIPAAEPASMRYPVGAHPPVGACHVSVTVGPFAAAVSPLGAPGVVVQPPPFCTMTTISFDAPLVPPALRARIRTK